MADQKAVAREQSSAWEIVIAQDCHGLRLDQALARLVPGLGRRGVKRILAKCRVDVEGRLRAAGARVDEGERLRVSAPEPGLTGETGEATAWKAGALTAHVAGRNADFAALVKPAGMHCERLSKRTGADPPGRPAVRSMGGAGPTLADILPDLLPEVSAILLNRLDQPVSGLVLGALHERAARDYALWQDQGRVRKEYLALVHGRLDQPMEIRRALDTARRRKVRALSGEEPDALRWTRVTPLVMARDDCQKILTVMARSGLLAGGEGGQPADGCVMREPDGEITAVRVVIHKGRRHQIRAHLACAGYPVLFDPLYGPGPDVGFIGLHHRQVTLPGFRIGTGCEFGSIQ